MRLCPFLLLAACGRLGFEPRPGPAAPDAAACPAGAACTPAAACWTGTCSAGGACLPDQPRTGTCTAGTCTSSGLCEGTTASPLALVADPYDLLGMGIDRQGDRMLLGSPGPGTARIVEKGGDGTWQDVAPITSALSGMNVDFGLAVALDGDRALVGAHSYNVGHGAADVFERGPSGTWSAVATLSEPGVFDFGSALDLQGTRAIVGAESSSTAFIYEQTAPATWTRVATLGPYDNDFGKNVVLDGDRAFVSSTWEPNTDATECGSVRVFERDLSGTWQLVAHLQPPVTEKVDAFGIGMAVDHDVLAVGGEWASRDVSAAGVVIVYRRDATGTWQLEAALHEADEVPDADLGRGVAVAGDVIVATATRATDGLVAAFRRQPDGRWLEIARLIDPLGALAGYGTGGVESDLQVRLDGGEAMVGAPYRSPTSTREGGVVRYDLAGL